MSISRSPVLSDSPRTTTELTGDPRAARTRQGILDAVSRLPVHDRESISVTDIVREAGISRSSFYAHFSSLDDLAIALLRQEFWSIAPEQLDASARQNASQRDAARVGYHGLVDHLSRHHSIYVNVLGLPVSRRAFDDAVARYSGQLLSSFADSDAVPGIRQTVAAKYMAGGTLTLVGAWITGELGLTKDELVDHLVELLPPWLT